MDNQLSENKRLRLNITGAVQGVGFRPFVYRKARELALNGWILNTSEGVTVEIEGPTHQLDRFLRQLDKDKPNLSAIQSLQRTEVSPRGDLSFEIKESKAPTQKTALILPDMATCADCLKEIFEPVNRRYLYPFTNCTHCGPRYSILESLPYDRPNTTMKSFQMCDECHAEYNDPRDRRFHAQPNACPRCGPQVALLNRHGEELAQKDEALRQSALAIKKGLIVAVKGIGGYHLVADALNEEAVTILRERKKRIYKPLALMMRDQQMVECYFNITQQEKDLISSPQAPIVLLSKNQVVATNPIAASVAPNNGFYGVMLAYSPMHHILLNLLDQPIVCTSGNLADEPICKDEDEAMTRLVDIADVLLVHNRPIVRSLDDSVVQVVMGKMSMIRKARGYAPLPIAISDDGPSVLAVGGHLKNTIAMNINNNLFVSQHIGDLQESESFRAFHQSLDTLNDVYLPKISHIVCDKHPDYYTTHFAKEASLPLISVQHHHAHIVACMAEHYIDEQVLGIAWDGSGWGDDKTVWGGEFLIADLSEYRRIATFKNFRLPGGEKAVREPRRVGLAVLYEAFEGRLDEQMNHPLLKHIKPHELNLLLQMIKKRFNSPMTSSVGRLFDAVAAISGVCYLNHEEGQAAMMMEELIDNRSFLEYYPYACNQVGNELYLIDWRIMIRKIIDDIHMAQPMNQISMKFHNTLVEMAVTVAKKVGKNKVVISGGCFQNKYLTERLILRLREEGFTPFWHQKVPTNDGGLAFGQAACAIRQLNRKILSKES